jgi:RHS repeat-associated protein
MGYALLQEKPLLGAKFLPCPKSARERAVDRWFARGKPDVKVRCASDLVLHTDHLGTPQVITYPDQNIAWEAEYDPFGQATVTTEFITNHLRFPGQYYDSETGLHYNEQRYYSNDLGRFITSNPTGLEGGINTYSYALQNPINYYDPNGEAAQAAAGLCFIPGVGWISCAVAGTVATGATLLCIISGACDQIGQAILQCFDGTDEDEKEARCEELNRIDTDTCNGITRARGKAAGAACHASASERYAACLRGLPLPPLNTWNN